MPVVYCQSCGRKSRAPQEAVGKHGKCSSCGTSMLIPPTDMAPPEGPPAATPLETAAVTPEERPISRNGRSKVLLAAGAGLVLCSLVGTALLLHFYQVRRENERREQERVERVRANEATAVAMIRRIGDAQRLFARTDYNFDGILEYAQHLRGGNGNFGLCFGPERNRTLALIGNDLADASVDELGGKAKPFCGYFFRLLKAQGSGGAGGAKKYIDSNGRMIHGFAVIAYPEQYGISGLHTYALSDKEGTLMKDFGNGTATLAKSVQEFNPDSSWTEENWVPPNYLNECAKCGGSGTLATPCRFCQGYGKKNGMPCSACSGSGKPRCDVCGGSGREQ